MIFSLKFSSILHSVDISLNSKTFESIWKHFTSEGGMTYDDFVASTMKIQTLTGMEIIITPPPPKKNKKNKKQYLLCKCNCFEHSPKHAAIQQYLLNCKTARTTLTIHIVAIHIPTYSII